MATKWRQAAEDSNQRDLSSFLDWLRQRFVLGEWSPASPGAEPRLQPARIQNAALLAAYYEVDVDAVERHVQRVLGMLHGDGGAA